MVDMLDFVEEISFEEIAEVWAAELWPDKKNGVAKANEWTWHWLQKELGKDKRMAKDAIPTFVCIKSGK